MPLSLHRKVETEADVRPHIDFYSDNWGEIHPNEWQTATDKSGKERLSAYGGLFRVNPYQKVRGIYHTLQSDKLVSIRSHHVEDARIVGAVIGYDTFRLPDARFVFEESWNPDRLPLDVAAAGIFRYVQGDYDLITTSELDREVAAALNAEREAMHKHHGNL